MSGCHDCGATLNRENKSGYCKKHISAALARDPVWREKQREATRRALHSDPLKLERKRAIAREIFHLPQSIEARRKHCNERKLWEAGNAAQPKGSAARMMAGSRGSATKLAWCPAPLRDEYRKLAAMRDVSAAQARAMIEEQHELEMARWRRSVGIEVAPSRFEPAEPDLTPLETAIELVAHRFKVTIGKLFSDSRQAELVSARCALGLAMKRERYSLKQIAQAMHKCDHSTSIHWVRKGEELAKRDRQFAAIVDELVACWHPVAVAA